MGAGVFFLILIKRDVTIVYLVIISDLLRIPYLNALDFVIVRVNPINIATNQVFAVIVRFLRSDFHYTKAVCALPAVLIILILVTVEVIKTLDAAARQNLVQLLFELVIVVVPFVKSLLQSGNIRLDEPIPAGKNILYALVCNFTKKRMTNLDVAVYLVFLQNTVAVHIDDFPVQDVMLALVIVLTFPRSLFALAVFVLHDKLFNLFRRQHGKHLLSFCCIRKGNG